MSAAGDTSPNAGRLAGARVLVELGETYDAERQVSQLLEALPEDLDGLSLMAKIKHVSGDLVQLVACWAQLYAVLPPADATLAQLKALEALVRDPAGAAAEFVASSRFRTVHSTTLWLELAEVFAELAQGNPEVARHKALRAQAAHRYPPAARKLTTLAAASVCERTGQRAEALQLVETLGAESGFESDFDRVRMLARLYEADGDPDRLESAFHIWKFLERRSDHVETHSRLIALCRKRGGPERADAEERAQLLAFHRHMQRPLFDEVVKVASTRYLPLHRLAGLSLPAEQVPEQPARAHTLALALTGERAQARERLKAAATLLDQKYLADLLVLEGDLQQAAAVYLEVLRDDPHDLRLIEWLLDHRELIAKGDDARTFTGSLLKPMSEALDEALRAAPLRPSLWRYRALVSRLGDSPSSAWLEEQRAEQLAQRAGRPPSCCAVLAPAVLRVLGRARGVIGEVTVERVRLDGADGGLDGSGLHRLDPRLRRSLHRLFDAMRAFAAKTAGAPPDDRAHRYRLRLSGVVEQVAGPSLELPVALAFLAAMLGLEPKRSVAVAGALKVERGGPIALLPDGDPELAVKAAYHRNLGCLVLPSASRDSLERNPRIPRPIERQLVRYAACFEDAVALVLGELASVPFSRGASPRPAAPRPAPPQ